MKENKILIVEDEILVAKDLELTLKTEGYDVVGMADSHQTASDIFEAHLPDLLLCDINIKGPLNGIETAERLKKIKKVPVIFLTAYADTMTVTDAIATNPAAYLIKPFTEQQLVIAIKLAFDQFYGQDPFGEDLGLLSGRELEILKLLSLGLNSDDISNQLHISRHTVITHRKNLHKKFGVKKTSELLLYAVKRGLIK